MVKEVKQYQAADGTCFTSKAEAEAYEEMLHNPHFKKIQDRIEKLEHDILTIKAEIATLHREPAKPSWPIGTAIMYDQYHKPQTEFNYKAYNPATGVQNG